MTAKHRGKKNKHNHEDFNHLNHESSEPEARGENQNVLLFILFLLIVVGGATATWYCFQQHQSITYLADNFVGMQMKMVKLQSFQEEIRQTNEKQHGTGGFEHRLNILEESYTLAQKQVVMALAMTEQLKTSDLPAQVLSLHTEMKARLAEMQHATVSTEQLIQLQAKLKGKSEEFEAVRLQVEGLVGLSTELAQSMEGLTGSLAEAEAKLEERAGLLGTLSATMEGQASDLLGLKEQVSANQAQLEASTAEITSVRELFEKEQTQRAQQAREGQLVTVQKSLQEQNSAAHSLHSELRAQLEVVQKQLEGGVQADEPSEEVEEEAAPAEEEQAAAAEEVEEEEAAHLDVKSVEQEDSAVTEEQTAPAEEEVVEEEQEDLAEAAPEEEVQAVENVEEQVEEEDSEAEEEQAMEEEEEQPEEDEASPEEEL
ncbi:protein Ycf2 isoform X3 [Coregonus clupeaformis]|uniref:protein Ycf2 isoform X3 n=1 Tax=Coregonus clupeaformis TaxID=59861 RepID=UPI001BE01878|nr:protein Ycf2 isoform X3 [Coregonus clupeaformis]